MLKNTSFSQFWSCFTTPVAPMFCFLGALCQSINCTSKVFFRIFWVGIFIGFSVTNVNAATNYWMMTDFGTSARMIGYGGVEGFGSSADTVFENPAGLFRIHQNSVSLFTTKIMDEVNYFSGAMASRTPWGVFGLGYMHASVWDIPHTAEDVKGRFYARYNFDYKNTIVRGSYQYSLSPHLHIGASVSQYMHAFDGVSGRGYDLDLGAVYLYDRYEFSALLRNLMNHNVDYDDDGIEELSRQYTVSAKAKVIPQVDVMGQMKFAYDQTMTSVGVVYTPTLLPYLKVSTGYRQFVTLDDVDDTYELGFMLDFSDVEFHYTYEKSGHVSYDNNNYFSVSVKF